MILHIILPLLAVVSQNITQVLSQGFKHNLIILPSEYVRIVLYIMAVTTYPLWKEAYVLVWASPQYADVTVPREQYS